MNKHKNVKNTNFSRERSPSIDILFDDGEVSISLYAGSIEKNAKKLSEIELEQVISILLRDKEAMLKQYDFPLVFEEMLYDLIEVQVKRYGVRARKLGYSISLGKLEEILGEYYKIKEVCASSIDVGSDRRNAERIDLESDCRYLVLSFREGEEEDEK